MRPSQGIHQEHLQHPVTGRGLVNGDSIYFQTAKGPCSGKVCAVGKHGCTVDADDARHSVKWEHVLGHRERIDRHLDLVDRGEDGAIVADEKGERSYVAGDIPEARGYLDDLTDVAAPETGDLVTRRIDQEMRSAGAYLVLGAALPDANVLVGESVKGAPGLLRHLEEAGMTVPYEAVPRTQVQDGEESQGILFGFQVEPEQIQGLVNAVAAFQRKTAVDTDEILVIGAKVSGMEPAQLSTREMGGRTVLVVSGEPPDGFETVEVYASSGVVEEMSKGLMFEAAELPKKPVLILFAKGSIKNGPGLTLRDTQDSRGNTVKRWMKTTEDQPADKRPAGAERETRGAAAGYGTHNIDIGDKVSFHTGDKHGAGKIVSVGKDGATVEDHDGNEHQVTWGEITGQTHVANPSKDQKANVRGEQQPIPPGEFKAGDYFTAHDDAEVTSESILEGFPPDTKSKIEAVNERLLSIEQTQKTYKNGGEYTAERREVHVKIVNHFLSKRRIEAATPEDGADPSFTIIGGRGGSGKSWFEGNVFDPSKAIVLDADAIKGMLGEYEGWNAFQVHEESSDLFDALTNMAQDMGLNIVHDATMKTEKKAVALVQRFKDAGYRTEAHYMHLPRQEAAKRAIARFLGKTQRYVPTEVILGNIGNERSFDAVKGMVDKWSFRDNNVGRKDQPILISGSDADGSDDEGAAGKTGNGQVRDGLPPGQEGRSRDQDTKLHSAADRETGVSTPGRIKHAIRRRLQQAGRLKKALLLFFRGAPK